MNSKAVLLFFALATSLWARQGLVETRDGKRFQGQIRLDASALIIADAKLDLLARVELTNLLELTFQADAAEAPAPAADGAAAQETTAPSSGWRNEDIGSVNAGGSASWNAGVLRVESSGTNIAGDSDAFHFVYRRVKGDSEIVTRVLQVQPSAPRAKAGVMMRDGLSADCRNVLLALRPGRGGVFQWREAQGEATTGQPQFDLLVPSWIRLQREGDTFTAYRSNNGRQWRPVNHIALPMSENIYVGLAVAGTRESIASASVANVTHSLFDQVREGAAAKESPFVPRVRLRGGSLVVGRILAADASGIRFRGAESRPAVSLRDATSILFQGLPYRFTPLIEAGRSGVLLAGGEFIEGDCRGVENGKVTISSVLFGLRSFDSSRDVVALVLSKPALARHDCEVKTVGGSIWLGTDLEIARDEIHLHDAALGGCRFSIHELAEIRWHGKS
jgi:hypothetical protein